MFRSACSISGLFSYPVSDQISGIDIWYWYIGWIQDTERSEYPAV